MKKKSYDELDFTDDFLFGKIMTTDLELARELVEIILNLRIREIRLAETQKSEKFTAIDRGVRYDVYIEDDKNTVYDIEMQTSAEANIGKRMRYYQGMIDLDTLEASDPFSKLKKSYIIFICTKKPTGLRPTLPLYTFSSVCKEDSSVELGDDSYKVIVNADCSFEGVSSRLRNFLEYLKTQKTSDDFTKRIMNAVKESKNAEGWRVDYMTMLRKLAMEREEGREEGREGIILEGVRRGMITVDDGAALLEKTVEEIQTMLTEQKS